MPSDSRAFFPIGGPAGAALRGFGVLLAVFLAAGISLGGCGDSPHGRREARASAARLPVTLLPLGEALDAAELSGLAWYGDWLVLLPQNPGQFAPPEARPGEGRVFGLHRDSLRAALDAKASGKQRPPLHPRPVPFLAPGVAEATPGFDGYEALAFRSGSIFVAVEIGHSAESMQGLVVRGRVTGPLDTIRLNAGATAALPAQAAIDNFSYEALVANPRDVMALYESNGAARNPAPQAARFSYDLQPLPPLPFPRLEYRLTDATPLDAGQRFWVINYYWPGDSTRLQPGPDALSSPASLSASAERAHVKGVRSSNERRVERLVELKRTGDTLALSDHAPIRLQFDASGRSRNWEGLARLGTRGFLLVTDEYPRTLLGFVPRQARGGAARSRPTWGPAWLDPAETVLVVLAGLALAVLGLLAARYPKAAWRFTRERFQVGTAYGLSLTVAAVFVGGAFWIFTEIVETWAQPAHLDRIDAAVDQLARAWATPGGTAVMRVVTWLGSGWAATLIVGGVALWLYRQQRAWRELAVLLVGFGAGEALVYALKALFHRTRPHGGLLALGASFPSGHAFTAFLTCGLLAYLLWRLPILRRWRYGGMALLALVALLVGASRLYLRAHYVTDVAGGFVLAAGWLAATITLTSVLGARHRQRGTTKTSHER